MELSSFQLEHMTVSPPIAAILNITPNHLDRHGTMQAYESAKARILQFQKSEDVAILNRDDSRAWSMRETRKGGLLSFSMRELDADLEGAYLQDGLLSLRTHGTYLPLLPRSRIKLRGDHNIANVLAAFTIGHAAGLPLDAMLQAAEEFEGVPHRLEFVRELRGTRWYNDSIATAPERTMAALRAFDEPIVLLLGGRDKDLPWGDLAALMHQKVDHAIVFGEASDKILTALHAGIPSGKAEPFSIDVCETLEQAVVRAAEVAAEGDIVLFSPGATSFDAFKDFEDRGVQFRRWVHAL